MSNDNHNYAVIMAGGGGTRLWPLSRKNRPKQMLALFDQRTFFQMAVERLDRLFPPERILIVTVKDQAAELQKQCPGIPPQNYIMEHQGRGTASVIGLAAVALQKLDPQAVMVVLAADHYITNTSLFSRLLQAACLAAQDGYLVTLGIEPTYPGTGFGYIQAGEAVGSYLDLPAMRVQRFKEKPDEAQARAMLASGGHTWNSGMFAWRVQNILTEIDHQMPHLSAGLQRISGAWGQPDQQAIIEQVWDDLRTVSIDFGVMEGASNVIVLPAANLGWSDIGSWDSLFATAAGDEHGNLVLRGEHLSLDTSNSLIYQNQPDRLVVTIGVDDVVIVDTGDVLLVCHRDHAQKVRQVVDLLKQKGSQYL